jgi:triacylglycerol esterase/lipase EstA (alpha/beta hydrolase family)
LDINYGNYFDRDPSPGPKITATEHRKRAILFANDMEKYKDWTWSKKNKAHFICHSQGGTTVRLLISLMAWGDDRHPTYFGEPGRDGWAISVTTLGTPHKGTTICDVVRKLLSVSSSSKCSTFIPYMASLFLSQAVAPVTSTNISILLFMLVGIRA